MTVTYDQECVDRLIAEAIEKERKEFAIHAVDIARRAIRLEREALCKAMEEQNTWDLFEPASTAIQVIRERRQQ